MSQVDQTNRTKIRVAVIGAAGRMVGTVCEAVEGAEDMELVARIDAGEEIHLLAGHSYDRPLAARSAGTLTLTDGDDALTLEATLDEGTSWARDFLAAYRAGLVKGLSPGFRVPRGGERIEHRSQGVLRTVTAADLFEVSAVTRPAYPEAQIEARCWETHQDRQPLRTAVHALNRWRV